MLSSKKFLPLFFTQFLGAFNDNLFKNALVILITYKLADKMSLELKPTLSLIGILFISPYIFFSDIAGRIGDSFNKKTAVRYIKLAEIFIMLLGIYGYYNEDLNILYVAIFLMGTQSTFFSPIKYSLLPDHLPKNKLIKANGLISMGTFAAILCGTLIGTTIILRESGIFLTSTLILSISILGFLACLLIPSTPAKTTDKKIFKFNIFSVISHLRKDRPTLKTALLISYFWYLGALILTLLPDYGKNILGIDEKTVAFLLIIFVAGISAGSLFVNIILKNNIITKTLLPAQIGIFIGIIALYYISNLYTKPEQLQNLSSFMASYKAWLISVCFFIITFFAGIYIVPLNAKLQSLTKKDSRAKILAASALINAIMMVLSSICIIIATKLGLDSTKILFTNAFLCFLVIYYGKLRTNI